MKRIFYDTEFTCLKSSAKLVSLALVSETGDELYLELCDTYRSADLSEFAAEHVVPLLQGGRYEVTWAEAKVKLREWIMKQGDCIIATDSLQWDWVWVEALLDRNFPENLTVPPLILSVNYLHDYKLFEEVLTRELSSLRRHHARDDALANLRAWQASGGDTL